MKIAWIDARATADGGAERYVVETASLLREEHGVSSFLFYDVRSRVDVETTRAFDGLFPLVAIRAQLLDLAPDVVFVHQLFDEGMLAEILAAGIPAVRFLHDHRLLCLREHKYTALEQRPCTQAPGVGCYGCLGFLRRAADPSRELGLVSLGELRARIGRHRTMEAVVVGSTYMKEQAAAAGFEPSRIVVTPLGVATVEDGDAPRSATQLLFVGALTTGKGVDVLLDALARTGPGTTLVLAGDGPQRATLEAQARTLGIAARTTFLGRVGRAEVTTLLQTSAALVLPCRQPESFGLVGVEAMAHGLPVVASGLGGVREWLDHGRTGLEVPPLDPGALARAVDTLVGSPELARRLGEEGRRVQRARFTSTRHAQDLLRLLSNAAARRRAA